ncbi:MAG TPA: alpha/beta-hydrolase family protein [Lapillicoccus sp.]|uniref:alpha/beta hydrolase n=1 Tax=Lapillicoccus sp. TaxID=1909287 RepID=UPI002F93D6F6
MGVDTATERSVETPRARRPSWPRRLWWRLRHWVLNLPRFPVALAFLGYLASDTPSLLPRPWYFQGLIGGISALIFYVIGLVIAEIWQLFARWSGFRMTIRPGARTVLRRIWYVLVALAVLAYPFVNAAWHTYVTAYVGEQPPGPLYPLASILTAILVGALFIGVYHLFAALTHWLTARLERRAVRVAIARLVATVVTIVAIAAVFDQVVIRGLLLAAKEQADAVNQSTPAGIFTPASPMRSGGPGSLVPWDSIGADGKSFIASGPNAARVSVVTRDDEAKQPIRVFASADKDRNLEDTKNLVLAEMDRTKAWERKAILVVTSTSTGFVNEWSAESFEYLLHGDTAIAAMQYSTLPSALGLLTARDEPPKVGRLLFKAVAARIASMPQDQRPKLYAGGESLGAYGGNGAFDSPDDMLAQVDGALWTGTPSFTPNHETLTAQRAFGSTEVNPTIGNGVHIRFAGNEAELTADQFGHSLGVWNAPRVVYLQHDSDPVVWWSPDLILNTPDWLVETRQPGTPMSYMSWLPFVTFWQVTADMAMSNTVPGGYGHRYFETETVPAWAGIMGMDPNTDYTRIESAINEANQGASG